MRRHSAPALLLILVAGCAMPVDGVAGEGAEVAPVRFELEYGEDSLVSGVRLVNDGVEELSFAPSRVGYAPMPRLFVEARQENGQFAGRAEWYPERELGTAEEWGLPPGGAMSFPAGYSARDLRPGDYRVGLFLYDAGDSAQRVSRELGRTGWPLELVDAALALRDEAAEASCTSLVRVMTHQLLADTDADGIALMASGLREPWARERLRQEMFTRGAFASELAQLVRDAPLDELDGLFDALGRAPDRVQVPVQRAASERLLELVQNPAAELQPFHLRVLEHMVAHWSGDAPPILIERLESGHDAGYALDGLLHLFVSARSKFRAMRPRIVAAIQRRCAGVRGEDHVRSCARARSAYDCESCGRMVTGGFSTSCSCGGFASVGSARCHVLSERWDRMVDRAPVPEDYALPSQVERVAPDDVAASSDADLSELGDADGG